MNRYRLIVQTFFSRKKLYILLKRGQRNYSTYVTKIKRKVPEIKSRDVEFLANLIIFQYYNRYRIAIKIARKDIDTRIRISANYIIIINLELLASELFQ